MLQLSNSLLDVPILSLRTGSPIALATKPIINPFNLKIEAWYVIDEMDRKKDLVLMVQDIREFIEKGFVINDYEDLSEPDDLVRLREIMDQNFELLGKKVITNYQKHLGRVEDYAADKESLYIQKIYVAQSLFRSLTGGQLSIDRSQIIEITKKRIVVREADVKAGAAAAVPA